MRSSERGGVWRTATVPWCGSSGRREGGGNEEAAEGCATDGRLSSGRGRGAGRSLLRVIADYDWDTRILEAEE